MHDPAGPDAWTSELHWDDEVDVLCVGAGPGVLAHAVFCAGLDTDVLLVDGVLADLADAETLAYLDSMTEDLGAVAPDAEDLKLSVIRAEAAPECADPRAPIEPFIGSRLRDFARRCVASPFGVLYTEVPDAGRSAMRTEAGDTIQVAAVGAVRAGDRPGAALVAWLDEQAHQRGLGRATDSVVRLIFENGRVAGAELATPSGPRLVRAVRGLAASTRPAPAAAEWPVQAEPGERVAEVAIVACTAGKFGRLVLLNPH